MRLYARLLPRSLVGRVFALYTFALAAFVGAGLAVFYRHQFAHEIDAAQARTDALVNVVAPALSDSAVIGDYDTIQRTLDHTIARSDFAYAAFIDVKGGTIQATRSDPPDVPPPAWLAERVNSHLYETNLPVVVGGRDYGVLRLRYAADQIAGELWQQARIALGLAGAAFGLGLLIIWLPLRHWLGNLGRLQSLGEEMRSGTPQPTRLADDAPIEFQRTFEAMSRVAATLVTQREQAAVTLQAIADGVLTLDAQGRVVLANPAACDVLGAPLAALLGQPARELLPELFSDGTAYVPWRGRRLTITAGDGLARMVDTTLSPILDGDGLAQGYVLAWRDVSEQHLLDQRLQDELRSRRSAITALRRVLEGLMPHSTGRRGDEDDDDIEAISVMISRLVMRMQEHADQLGAIFALSPDGFVSFDAAGAVSWVSPAFGRLTGLDATEALGLDEAAFARLFAARCLGPGAGFPSFEELHKLEAGIGRPRRRCVVEVEHPARRTLELALRRGDGRTLSRVLHLRDVTIESEVDQMKSEFLSTAAHELRTPMASIYGFSELMMHRRLAPERQQEVISTIYRQTGLMIAIVNELLDLARIEARRGKDFVIETLDLHALVSEVVHDFKPPDDRAPASLARPAIDLAVKADRGKLVQALGNILSNAYKYSPGGGDVELDFVHDDEGGAPRVGVRVRDHGMGMTPEQLARVCERFYRADASGSIPGTGLGMAIVKEIVELLGGSLALESRVAEGTVVTLWLPRLPAKPAARSAPPEPLATQAAIG